MSSIAVTASATGTGTVSLVAPVTNTNRTINLPDSNGTIVTSATAGVPINGPAFSAYANAGQTLTNSTWTKVLANIEIFDTNGNYDNVTNCRFTPTVAGYYQINAGVRVEATTSIAYGVVGIFKNGSPIRETVSGPFAGNYSNPNTSIVSYLNGSTDYIELYAIAAGTGTLTTSPNTTQTNFQAALVRSAT
jgi:hypothetical protein